MGSSRDLRKQFDLLKLVWFGVLFFIFLYALGAHYILTSTPSNPQNKWVNPKVARMVFFGMSFLSLAIIPVIRVTFLKDADRVPDIESANSGKFVMGRYFMGNFFIFALSEVPAVYGLVLLAQTRVMGDFYSLAALALIALIFNFPRSPIEK